MTLSGLRGGNPLAIAAFLTVCIVWGTTYLGIRVAVESIPPVATTPFWASILDALRAGGERIRLPRLAALAVGFGGVAMLVVTESAGHGLGSRFTAGAVAILGGAFAWQAGSIYGKHLRSFVAMVYSTFVGTENAA